jgi:hypothetical protein
MNRFLDNATRIFEAAEAVAGAGTPPSDMTILIGTGGGISLVADSDWPLDSLEMNTGAAMVYRVRQQNGKVLVEGKAGAHACRLEAADSNLIARRLLANPVRFAVIQSALALA